MRVRTPCAALAAALGFIVCACSGRGGRDVLLITLDTQRADRLGCYGYRNQLTPNLDRLAAEGVLFEDASATAPITLPSHASLLTGRYPFSTGVRNNGTFVLPTSETTLAETLRQAGWSTGAVIGAFPLNRRFGLAQGFDLYDDDIPLPPAVEGKGLPISFAERDARAVTDRALAAWTKLPAGPRFLWVHYFDPHAPYDPPEPFRARHAAQPYDGETAFVDEHAGRLIDAIRRRSPRALIVVAGDHGEALGEHGEKTHGIFVYQSTIRVPLLMVAPGRWPAAARVAEPVSLVDVFPTLCALLGVSPPAGVEGRDLGPAIAGKPAPGAAPYAESLLPSLQFRFSELTMLRRGPLKYVDAPQPELFDLSRDPDETTNLLGSRPEEAEIAAALAERLRSADPGASSRAAGGLDPESEAKLRSLGYVAGGAPVPRAGASRGRDPKTMIGYLHEYDLAVEQVAEGKFEEGIRRLRQLLPRAPENFMARYQIAGGLFGAGRLAECAAELRAVVTMEPTFTNAHLMLGEVLGRLGEFEEAVRSYEAGAATAPLAAEPRFALGQLMESAGRFDAAATAYQAAIRLAPHDHEIVERFLALRAGRGTLDAGAEDLRSLARDFPDSAAIWTGLAKAERLRGQATLASDALRRALAIDADDPDALTLEGEARLETRDARGAIDAFQRAVDRAPASVEARFGLARSLLAAGRTREADAAIAEVLRLNPRFSPAHRLRGRRLERSGDLAGAADAYRRALEANPTDREAWEALRRIGASR